jgi:hypothetical protein
MSRIAYCPACSAIENGIKSRVTLEHTCGLEAGEVPPKRKTFKERLAEEQAKQTAVKPMTNNTQLPAEAITPQGALTMIYVPCHEDDPRICGCYTSLDGQSLCYVRESNVPMIEQGAIWVKASEFKYEVGASYNAKDSQSKGAGRFDENGDFIWGDTSITHANDQCDLFILAESPAAPLSQERADLIREVNNRDLEGVNTSNNDHHY